MTLDLTTVRDKDEVKKRAALALIAEQRSADAADFCRRAETVPNLNGMVLLVRQYLTVKMSLSDG